MKKFFLIAAAAAMVLSSCSKNTVSEDTSEANAINFGTYAGRSITKADGTFVNNDVRANLPANTSFGVFGYATTNAFTTANFLCNFMNGTQITYDGTNYAYKNTADTKYWPKSNDIKLNFFAYYPYGEATYTNLTPGVGYFDFTAKSTPETQVDFLVSDFAKDQLFTTNTTKNGQVDLLFHHMLTQVNIKAAVDQVVDGIDVKVTNVTFNKELFSTGKLEYKSTGFEWTSATTAFTNDLVVPMKQDALTTTSAFIATGTNGANGALLMVPQTIPANQTIATITYKINDKAQAPVKISFPDAQTWEKGTRVNYNVTIHLFYSDELHKVTFTAQVEKWNKATSTDVNKPADI